jgi:hypothetical protein
VGFCVGFSAVFEPEADYAHENQREDNCTQALVHLSLCSRCMFSAASSALRFASFVSSLPHVSTGKLQKCFSLHVPSHE